MLLLFRFTAASLNQARAHSGFSAQNCVTAQANDHADVERLASYLLRTPLSLERMKFVDNENKVFYQNKRRHGPCS